MRSSGVVGLTTPPERLYAVAMNSTTTQTAQATPSLTWTQRKTTDSFGRHNATTEHVTTYAGREFALRKADDLYFLWIDGAPSAGRIYFTTLREGKATVAKAVTSW